MADVFISYAQKDRPLAQSLADRLQAKGLTVWWDTELIGGSTFRQEIEAELEAARVVTVIWSPDSAASRFVIDEADVAAATGKLVSLLVGDFPPRKLPIGFRSIQSVAIGNADGIDRALKRMGLQPKTVAPEAPAAAPAAAAETDVEVQDEAAKEEEAWKFVLARRDRKLAEDFGRRFPESRYSFDAIARADLLAGRAQLKQRLAIALAVLTAVALGGTVLLFEWVGPWRPGATYYNPARQVAVALWLLLLVAGAIGVVVTARKLKQQDDEAISRLERQEGKREAP